MIFCKQSKGGMFASMFALWLMENIYMLCAVWLFYTTVSNVKSCHNCLVGHCRSCLLHSAHATVSYSRHKPNLPTCTYLHLSGHSSPRILTAINSSLGMLCVTGIILGDVCRHISRSCKPQSIVTVGDRPNLGGDVADSGGLVECTSLWEPRVSDFI